MKVEAEELEELLGSDGLSDFPVASRSRWDKYKTKWNAPWRQNSSASASEGWWQKGQEQQRVGRSSAEKRVTEAVEDYLEHCVHVKVDLDVLESLMEPENLEVSLRCVLKY